ncbi:MAG TPA: META domain-containing protein [Sphingomicrobium sp.]|nr:META domain-containing protein [Sphingomicrobium sp.]
MVRALAVPALAMLLHACAAPQTPPVADLTGTDWRVVVVNGRETPAQGEYSMRFGAGGAFGAKFGCNLIGGEYRLSGGTLTVSNSTQTLMGCPEPAASFETQGSAILQRPMQVAFTSGERMTLGNAAGSITLDPMP